MPVKQQFVLGKAAQRSFDHLVETTTRKSQSRIPRRLQAVPQRVPPKDRIPLWNIGPGDRVRVIAGGFKGQIGTVDWVDRTKNRVHLQEDEFQRAKAMPTAKKGAIFTDPNFQPATKAFFPIPIHYSNVALVLQRTPEQEARDEFAMQQASGSGSTSTKLPEAVATRLRATNVRYDWRSRRWVWRRLAENVATVDRETGRSFAADWPKEARFAKFVRTKPKLPSAPSYNDTPYAEASKATFVPPEQTTKQDAKELRIRDLEFVNVYGRAKRNERWHARKEAERMAKELAEAMPTQARITVPIENSSASATV